MGIHWTIQYVIYIYIFSLKQLPWIYDYATVSYNKMLDHMQFWPAFTAYQQLY